MSNVSIDFDKAVNTLEKLHNNLFDENFANISSLAVKRALEIGRYEENLNIICNAIGYEFESRMMLLSGNSLDDKQKNASIDDLLVILDDVYRYVEVRRKYIEMSGEVQKLEEYSSTQKGILQERILQGFNEIFCQRYESAFRIFFSEGEPEEVREKIRTNRQDWTNDLIEKIQQEIRSKSKIRDSSNNDIKNWIIIASVFAQKDQRARITSINEEISKPTNLGGNDDHGYSSGKNTLKPLLLFLFIGVLVVASGIAWTRPINPPPDPPLQSTIPAATESIQPPPAHLQPAAVVVEDITPREIDWSRADTNQSESAPAFTLKGENLDQIQRMCLVREQDTNTCDENGTFPLQIIRRNETNTFGLQLAEINPGDFPLVASYLLRYQDLNQRFQTLKNFVTIRQIGPVIVNKSIDGATKAYIHPYATPRTFRDNIIPDWEIKPGDELEIIGYRGGNWVNVKRRSQDQRTGWIQIWAVDEKLPPLPRRTFTSTDQEWYSNSSDEFCINVRVKLKSDQFVDNAVVYASFIGDDKPEKTLRPKKDPNTQDGVVYEQCVSKPPEKLHVTLEYIPGTILLKNNENSEITRYSIDLSQASTFDGGSTTTVTFVEN